MSTRRPTKLCRQRFALVLALLGAASAPVLAAAPACKPATGSAGEAVQRLADDIRAHDSLYAYLARRNGPPSACAGRATRDQSGQDSQLVFSWPDGSRLEHTNSAPETSVILYSNPQGLADADALMATFRDHAARIGLHIDWRTAKAVSGASDAAARTEEYQDPDVNGIVRFMFDGRRRLVAASLSLAL